MRNDLLVEIKIPLYHLQQLDQRETLNKLPNAALIHMTIEPPLPLNEQNQGCLLTLEDIE